LIVDEQSQLGTLIDVASDILYAALFLESLIGVFGSRPHFLGELEPLQSTRSRGKAFSSELIRKQFARCGIVVDDEDAIGMADGAQGWRRPHRSPVRVSYAHPGSQSPPSFAALEIFGDGLMMFAGMPKARTITSKTC
jgi:hypothetical protein